MSHNIKLGQIITTSENRDAIHIAIAPVTSSEELRPGQHVALDHGKVDKVISIDSPLGAFSDDIGIVDPFLTRNVKPGERFFILLYPQTITSLRHEWTHPAFKESESSNEENNKSKQWIKSYAEGIGLTYDRLMEGTKDYLENDEYLYEGDLLEGVDLPDEFWKHYENVTGKTIDGNKKHNFFSCAC